MVGTAEFTPPFTPPAGASARTARSIHWGWWVAGGCAAFGCAAVALAVTIVVWLFSWLAPWFTVTEPWIEASNASPDGLYIVYSEGRGNGLDLEARVTIAAAGKGEEPEALLPWSRLLPVSVEWIGEREFVIDLDDRTRSGNRRLIRRSWRDVNYTIDRD